MKKREWVEANLLSDRESGDGGIAMSPSFDKQTYLFQIDVIKDWKGNMPGKHANKEYTYAQNPYGPSKSYAGQSMLPSLKQNRKLTPDEEADNKEVKEEYRRKGTLLTGTREADKQEKSELTREKPKKKPNTVSKKESLPQKITQYV